MTELQSTTDLLLAAAIKARDPDTFRALADSCDDVGDEAHAYGWREVARWMETPWKHEDHNSYKVRWPIRYVGQEGPACHFFVNDGIGEYDPVNNLPWLEPQMRAIDFPSRLAALTWLCEEFIKRR